MEAAVDPDAVARLHRVVGQETGQHILKLFATEGERRVSDIENAYAEGDRETVRFAAHTLKSSSGTVGARALSKRCQRLEETCHEGGWPTAKDVLEVRPLFVSAMRSLEKQVAP